MLANGLEQRRPAGRPPRAVGRAGTRVRMLALFLAGSAALGGGAGPAWPAQATPNGMDAARVRRELRAHTLRTVDGRRLVLSRLDGEVLVVNFWASWCAPCRRELPRLDALHAAIADRGGRVLAVSIDREARNVRRFVRAHRLTLPVYHDGPDGLARALDLPHVPFTIVLDREGNVAFATAGSDERSLEQIAATANRLLAAAPAGTPPFAGESP